MVRTRFAPSPTGYMHVGNLRSALYAYLFARKSKGSFVLRVEDTDQERYVPEALSVIYDTLRETEIIYDEGPDKDGGYGPYVQSERKELYRQYAQKLVESGAAYYCFCTPEELEARRTEAEAKGETFKYDKKCMNLSKEEIQARIARGDSYVIRQNTPTEGTVTFEDMIFGSITVECCTLDDMVLLKADGLPTYNFANVVDDHLMNITHVLRGSEYLSSTPKYSLLYAAFGWQEPKYVHLPLIMKDAHNKLSKRNGDASYQDLRAKGYLMDAIVNYIALLGWNPGTNQEVFSREELTEAFDLSGISKSPALFDPLKLRWMNGEHIKRLSPEKFLELASPWLDQSVAKGRYDYAKLAALLQPRCEVLGEIPQMIEFLPQVASYEKELYEHKKFKLTQEIALQALRLAEAALAALQDWTQESLHECMLSLAAQNAMKNGQVLWPVRVALSGLPSTPGGAIELADILGKEETLSRIRAGIEFLSA